MDHHRLAVVWRVCQQWSDGMRFALARPDQYREHQEAPQHLKGVVQDATSPVVSDGLQVVRQSLDLLWEHRAHRKDPAHAERLAEVP